MTTKAYAAENNYPLYITTIGRALRPLTSTYRAAVKELYFGDAPVRYAIMKKAPGPVRDEESGRPLRLNAGLRKWLESCLFEVMNDLEHRLPKHPQVEAMNLVRSCLLDGVPAKDGGNETHAPGMARPPLRYSKHEAFAAKWYLGQPEDTDSVGEVEELEPDDGDPS